MNIKKSQFIAGLMLALLGASVAWGFDRYQPPVNWEPGPINMQIKLGTDQTLADGTNFSTSVQEAMQSWNAVLGSAQFAPSIVAPGSSNSTNDINEIVFSSTIEGSDFGAGVLAVTLSSTYTSINRIAESDIIFNTAITWDSFRGGQLPGKHDIRRVAIHELGHTLGLDHPDEAGQSVAAVMNSRISYSPPIDGLQADDIAGGQSLYTFPANDNFAQAGGLNLNNNVAQASGENFAATKEPGEPNHADETGGASLWWRWTAPSNGGVSLNTQGSTFDTLLAVYTGSTVSALTSVASNDDVERGVIRTSAVTFTASAGTTYQIAVDGWDSSVGTATLNLAFTPDVAGAELPSIFSQPINRTTVEGPRWPGGPIGMASFSVLPRAGVGIPPVTLQWQRLPAGSTVWMNISDGGDYSGATGLVLTISPARFVMNGDQFRCVVTNIAGSIFSSVATLTVTPAAPVIFSQPQNQTVVTGSPASFSVTASGTQPMSFQWQRNSVDIPGATGSTLTIGGTTVAMSGDRFRCVVSNVAGSETSENALLTVNPPVPADVNATPSIAGHPASQTVNASQNAQFTVTANGTPAPTYQWQRQAAGNGTWSNLTNGGNYLGVTSTMLTVSGATLAMNGDQFRCVASNSSGSATSNPATLSVSWFAPVIMSQPVDMTVVTGSTVNFSIFASGAPSPAYQWQRLSAGGGFWENLSNGGVYSGTNASVLSINAATLAMNRDQFRCILSNPIGSTTSNAVALTVIVQNVSSISAGQGYSFFVKSGGTLWAMGFNPHGQLGDGTTNTRSTPVLVASQVTQISASSTNSHFIKSDGSLWSMGNNEDGQLGDGTTIQRATPVQVANNVTQVSAGRRHSLQVRTDGTMWGTGLFIATFFNSPSLLASGVIFAAADHGYSLFIKSDGTLWAMGINSYGNLGDGTTNSADLPKQVASGVVAVETGINHSLFIKTDGSLWATGSNFSGELGDGTTTQRLSPVLVATGVGKVSGGNEFSLFIKNDGTLWGMGRNDYGQLGDGTTTNRLNPVLIASGVSLVSAGFDHALFVKTDGSLWGMGTNFHGQLGLSAVGAFSSIPVQILSSVTPPSIDQQPTAVTVAIGGSPAFVIGAFGSPPPALQWQRFPAGGAFWADITNDGAYSGATSATLAITGASQAMSGDQFRCVATNSSGSITSSPAALTVTVPLPVIATQPVSQNVSLGSSINFSVTATSPVPVTYQWRKDGSPIVDATSATLTIPNFQVSDVGNYTVVVTNSAGAVTSNVATLAVALPPTITAQPVSQTVNAGSSATFSVGVASNAPVSYQWRKNSSPISGATQASYTIANVQATDAADYSVVVSNVAGSITSNSAALTVTFPPVITQQPANTQSVPGLGASFTVAATSDTPLSYQWMRLPVTGGVPTDVTNSLNNRGSQTASLALSGLVLSQSGDQYRCVVTNDAGSVTSALATLTVSAAVAPLMVSGGYLHTQFIRADGTLWAMGGNYAGQLGDGTTTARLLPTQTVTGVSSVASGFEHTLFTKLDGSLWAMGDNQLGELGVGDTVNRATPVQLSVGAISAAAGYRHSLFRKSDGTLWAMGWNAEGQLGDGTTISRSLPVKVADNVTSVTAGFSHSLFVKSDGTFWAMGRNNDNQFGEGMPARSLMPIQVGSGALSVSTGFFHSLILKVDGTLWATGSNAFGQLGDGTLVNPPAPVQMATGVVAMANGSYHSAFLKSDGTLWTVGRNDRGQLGIGTTGNRAVPVQIATNVLAVSAGLLQTHFIKTDGTLWSTGANDAGQLGDGTTIDRLSPVQVASGGYGLPATVANLSATNSATADRVRLTWTPVHGALFYEIWRGTTGDASAATLIAGRVNGAFYEDMAGNSGVSYFYFVRAVGPDGMGFSSAGVVGRQGNAVAPSIATQPISQTVNLGASVTFSVTANGSAPLSYQWRKNGASIPSANSSTLELSGVGIADAGNYDVLVSNIGGSAFSNTASLRVGSGPSLTQRPLSRLVAAGGSVELTIEALAGTTFQWKREGMIVAGASGPTLILENATWVDRGIYELTASLGGISERTLFQLNVAQSGVLLRGWGENGADQISIPSGLSNLAQISAGGAHSLALKGDGTVAAWGANDYGQSVVPAGLSDVVAVSAGEGHSLALKADGTVVAWGRNDQGQAQVPAGLTNVVAIFAGGLHNLALLMDGTVVGWGRDNEGQARAPIDFPNVVELAAGRYHNLALSNDGRVIFWGAYSEDRIVRINTEVSVRRLNRTFDTISLAAGGSRGAFLKNNGTLIAYGEDLSVQSNFAVSLTGVVAISAGAEHSLALKNDGTVVAWGYNSFGQMSVPAGLANVASVAAGGRHSLALEIVPAPVITASPASQTVFDGSAVTFAVSTTGAGPFSFQWRKNGNDLLGATAASYTIDSVQASDAGAYGVVVTNVAGSTTSSAATLTVIPETRQSQTINFGPLNDIAYTDGVIPLSATASSGLSVSFVVVSGPARLSGNNLELTDIGTITVRASQAGNANFAPAVPIQRIFTVSKVQYIGTLGDLNQIYDGTPRRVSIQLDPIGRVLAPNVGTSVNTTVTYDGSTTPPINAGSYDAVAIVQQPTYTLTATGTLVIAKADQTIAFTRPADQVFSATPITLIASATSSLPVSFSVVAGPAIASGGLLTPFGSGTITVRAFQAGDANRNAAAEVEQTFVILGDFASWQLAKFSLAELADANLSGPNAVFGADGIPNLVKYALGLEPKVNATTGLPEMSMTATDWVYTYARPTSVTDVSFVVESSTDLTTWSTTGVTHELVSSSNGVETWQARVSLATAAKVFFRLQVTRP